MDDAACFFLFNDLDRMTVASNTDPCATMVPGPRSEVSRPKNAPEGGVVFHARIQHTKKDPAKRSTGSLNLMKEVFQVVIPAS